jgi:methyl-accepting chemotaxis protein
MRKSAMMTDALPHRGRAARLRLGIGLALGASAGGMFWGVGIHSVSASPSLYWRLDNDKFDQLEERVAVQTVELAQVKAENAKLRQSQSDTSEDLSHFRATLANAEIGLAALRATTDENEARRRDTAAQIASNAAQLKDETLHLRMALDDTASEMGSVRASVANSAIGVDSLRATAAEMRQQIDRINVASDATGSIPKRHKHLRQQQEGGAAVRRRTGPIAGL